MKYILETLAEKDDDLFYCTKISYFKCFKLNNSDNNDGDNDSSNSNNNSRSCRSSSSNEFNLKCIIGFILKL